MGNPTRTEGKANNCRRDQFPWHSIKKVIKTTPSQFELKINERQMNLPSSSSSSSRPPCNTILIVAVLASVIIEQSICEHRQHETNYSFLHSHLSAVVPIHLLLLICHLQRYILTRLE